MNFICKKCGGEIYSKDDLIIRKISLWDSKYIIYIRLPFSSLFHKNCFSGKKDYIFVKIEENKIKNFNFLFFQNLFISIFLLLIVFFCVYFLGKDILEFDNFFLYFLVILFILSGFYLFNIYKLMKIRDFIKK